MKLKEDFHNSYKHSYEIYKAIVNNLLI